MHFMVQKLILRVKESNNGMNDTNYVFKLFVYMNWLISTLKNQLGIIVKCNAILR